jgi:hypothetical protein
MLGWSRLSNGELLDAADAAGFELMITCDQNVKYQQNLSMRRISLIVLGSNDWGIVKGYVEVISASVEAAVPNSYVFFEMPVNRKRPR